MKVRSRRRDLQCELKTTAAWGKIPVRGQGSADKSPALNVIHFFFILGRLEQALESDALRFGFQGLL